MSFGGQNKALVLLITETSVQLMVWQQRVLQLLAQFDTSADDQELFVEQLRLYPQHPVIIVADLIDENFRHDSIVHVGGADREALLKRKLDFAFRNTRYRIGTVIARETEGRKDDRIMLSAISKPERIDIWAKLLLQEKMAVQAATSIAHLINAWLPVEKLESEENLLISKLDADNNLRQTFVKNGRVMFSRLASLTTVPERRLGVEIVQESTQLRQYLERIQFLNYESSLRVQVLSSHPQDQVQVEPYSSELNCFESIDVTEKCAELQIHLREHSLLPSHYLIASILQRRKIENLYAPPSLTRFDDLRSLGRLLLCSAAVVLLLGFGLNVPSVMDQLDKQEQADTIRMQIGPLRSQYEALTQRFPETPVPPREMELIVSTHAVIRQQIISPIDALNLVAESLALSPGLQLTSLDWALEEERFIDTPDEFGNAPLPPESLQNIPADNALTGLILQQRTRIHLVINGEAYSPQSYRDAQDQVSNFINALAANDEVTVVDQQMPIDVRNDISVTATINDSEVRAPFTVELSLAIPHGGASDQVAGVTP
jgi:hypothetical protein